MNMEHQELRELFVHHPASPEELQQIQEIAIIGKSLAERFSLVKTEGPHSVSGELKTAAILSIKTGIMQINAAIIVGRAIKDQRKEGQPTADDILRRDMQSAMNAISALPELIGEARQRNKSADTQAAEPTKNFNLGYRSEEAQDRAPSQKEIEAELNKRHPNLVIKVRRRKSR
jgi:hypothetical protein